MMKLKRVLAVVLTVALCLSLVTVASAANYDSFADAATVEADFAKNATAVDVTVGLKIINGTNGNRLALGDTLTRAEAAKILAVADLGTAVAESINSKTIETGYSDMDGNWASGYVAYCTNKNYLTGSRGRFMPNDVLTGEAFGKMLLNVLGFGLTANADGSVTNKYEGNLWGVLVRADGSEIGLFEKVDSELSGAINRAEAMQMVYNALLNNAQQNANADAKQKLNDVASEFTLTANGDAGNDDFGRPTTTYVVAATNQPVATDVQASTKKIENTTVKLSDLKRELKYADTDELTVYIDGNKIVDVVTIADADDGLEAVLADYISGEAGKEVIGDNSVIIDFYKGDAAWTVTVINPYVETVTGDAKKKTDAEGNEYTYITLGGAEYKTADHTKGDVYTYHKGLDKDDKVVLADVKKVAAEDGTIDEYTIEDTKAVTSADAITVGGAAKAFAALTTDPDYSAVITNPGDKAAFYYDSYGNIVLVTKPSDGSAPTPDAAKVAGYYLVEAIEAQAYEPGNSSMITGDTSAVDAVAKVSVIDLNSGERKQLDLAIVEGDKELNEKTAKGQYYYAAPNGTPSDIEVTKASVKPDQVVGYYTVGDAIVIDGLEKLDDTKVEITNAATLVGPVPLAADALVKNTVEVAAADAFLSSATKTVILGVAPGATDNDPATYAVTAEYTGIATLPEKSAPVEVDGSKGAYFVVTEDGTATNVYVIQPSDTAAPSSYDVAIGKYLGTGALSTKGQAYRVEIGGETKTLYSGVDAKTNKAKAVSVDAAANAYAYVVTDKETGEVHAIKAATPATITVKAFDTTYVRDDKNKTYTYVEDGAAVVDATDKGLTLKPGVTADLYTAATYTDEIVPDKDGKIALVVITDDAKTPEAEEEAPGEG